MVAMGHGDCPYSALFWIGPVVGFAQKQREMFSMGGIVDRFDIISCIAAFGHSIIYNSQSKTVKHATKCVMLRNV